MDKRGPEDHAANVECEVCGDGPDLADYAAQSGRRDRRARTVAMM